MHQKYFIRSYMQHAQLAPPGRRKSWHKSSFASRRSLKIAQRVWSCKNSRSTGACNAYESQTNICRRQVRAGAKSDLIWLHSGFTRACFQRNFCRTFHTESVRINAALVHACNLRTARAHAADYWVLAIDIYIYGSGCWMPKCLTWPYKKTKFRVRRQIFHERTGDNEDIWRLRLSRFASNKYSVSTNANTCQLWS
jgi:hypothetical protein